VRHSERRRAQHGARGAGAHAAGALPHLDRGDRRRGRARRAHHAACVHHARRAGPAGQCAEGAGRLRSKAALRLAVLSLTVSSLAFAQAPSRDTLHIAFVGDINFARSIARNYIFAGRGGEIFAGVGDRLRAADITVGNLESLLLERGQFADTTNSWRFAGPQAQSIELLKAAGFDAVGDANNHSWDFGRDGLIENIAHLDSAGIPHSGTGPTLEAAWRPAIVHAKGWTVAIFSLTAIFNDTSLTVVGLPAECCIAWVDTLRAARRFRIARDSLGADLVIAFVHAGLEYQPAPRPIDVRRFRGLIHAGADAVIAHHPHVPQGLEYVDGKPIVYSLGNFVFKQGQPWTNRALWADFLVMPDRATRLTLVPLSAGYTPTFLTGADSAAVMAHVDSISGLISDRPRLPNPRARRSVAHPRRH
jgi:poly-gamma-glutamate synthesis protein (capsule biosynthesis protein)